MTDGDRLTLVRALLKAGAKVDDFTVAAAVAWGLTNVVEELLAAATDVDVGVGIAAYSRNFYSAYADAREVPVSESPAAIRAGIHFLYTGELPKSLLDVGDLVNTALLGDNPAMNVAALLLCRLRELADQRYASPAQPPQAPELLYRDEYEARYGAQAWYGAPRAQQSAVVRFHRELLALAQVSGELVLAATEALNGRVDPSLLGITDTPQPPPPQQHHFMGSYMAHSSDADESEAYDAPTRRTRRAARSRRTPQHPYHQQRGA
eukprot:gene42450-64157_t